MVGNEFIICGILWILINLSMYAELKDNLQAKWQKTVVLVFGGMLVPLTFVALFIGAFLVGTIKGISSVFNMLKGV